ncbi:hypothetical protein COW36_00190 [bacterium (Candidatus Blackallbacteria) CG17_big_fil_post_rev_8_21_14_2_50_48_46]|uniref:EF-hand domain-containing protein n=1 Tax=bacterium (Candidatus Blackallbacteria) CG17_big_fil_post_rev_8_21_14_2_50_48_46 TaxID=2014261 RepID=A0A2M7GBP9_9BACT|nr:MAG: hypothetical protein COW64_25695 [bacterium (Candidatus Blackallbacteria) CG18_big_fil_WC_8_21_14_2_50_49_26]PIW19600.1 MAG: hypothetical protein COW36_00190 [bacterium (Candidatus Blackallbacteria) CG17_big_fil_post_rev_8_21_14_2_50_48_46]PIW47668.1 MAG: hypothetical protein COW20_11850 [bacterium (Candidatus Blackallbacteria) CG13_big_fil_rev_8_21_14_2_50_49_14]
MPSISASNQQLLLKSFDSNQNQRLEELQVSPELKAKLDSNRDGELSASEVQTALGQDAVEIRQGSLQPASAQGLQIVGKETLQNVHQSVARTLSAPHVVAPRAADVVDAVASLLIDDKRSYAEQQADRRRYLEMSNLSYLSAVSSMRTSLRTVADMTAQGTDSRSRAIHSSALSALNSSTAWGTGVAVTGYLLGVSGLESVNSGLQVAYSGLKSQLNQIEAQTRNLPHPAQALQAADQKIAQAFAQAETLKNQQAQTDQTLESLSGQALEMEKKVTGRTGPYALVGTGVGVVAGATAGYFLGGGNLKSALIGAGAGAGGSAALGALVGKGIDHSYASKAEALHGQINTLKSFQPERPLGQLKSLNQSLYDLSLETRGTLDLDRAQGLEKSLQGVAAQAEKVQAELNQVQAAYQKGKP